MGDKTPDEMLASIRKMLTELSEMGTVSPDQMRMVAAKGLALAGQVWELDIVMQGIDLRDVPEGWVSIEDREAIKYNEGESK